MPTTATGPCGLNVLTLRMIGDKAFGSMKGAIYVERDEVLDKVFTEDL